MVKKETLRWCPVTSSISSSPLLSRSLRAKNVFGLNSSFIQNSCCRWDECNLWQLFLFLPNFLCCVLCQWMFDLQNIGESYFPPYKDQHHVTWSKDICSTTTFLLAWPALTASSLSCSAFLCSSSLIFFICHWTFFQSFISFTHLDVPQPLLLQEPLLHLVTLEIPLPQLRELPWRRFN